MCRTSCCRGQALSELVIALVVLLILITGVATFSSLCIKRQRLRRDARGEAGREALTHTTQGWVENDITEEHRMGAFHRINAFAHLEEFSPALVSRLPSSSYTLAARMDAEEELGLHTERRTETIPLDNTFTDLIYPKGNVRFDESVTFPAASGLW